MLIKRHLPPSLFTNKQRILSQGLQVTQTTIIYNKVCRGDDFLHVSSDTPPSGFAKDLPNSWQEVSSKLGRVNYEFLEMNAVILRRRNTLPAL